MHFQPFSNSIFGFDEKISSNLTYTNIERNDDSFLFDEPFDISSMEFVQLVLDSKDEGFGFVEKTKKINNYIILTGIKEGIVTVTPLKDSTVEEVEQALSEDRLGILEASKDDSTVIKFSKQRTTELESAGVNSVEIREPSGTVRTYTSFKFQTLSDRELNLLITQTKTYIVFLKTKADQSDKKTEKKILDLEIRSRYLQIERAVRTNHPELKHLLEGLLKTSPYKIAIRIVEAWNHRKAVEEEREQEEIKKALEIKHIIILEEIDKLELHKNIVKDLVVEKDFNSEGLTKKIVKQENSRRITHVNRFIGIYNGLNT